MTSQSESADANAALVLESIEALNACDTERLLAVVAPDIVIHYAEMPEPLHGRETWQQGFELIRRAFPDLDAHVDDFVAAENKVAIRVISWIIALILSRSESSSSSTCWPSTDRSVVCAFWDVATMKFSTWTIAAFGSTIRK
jgi:hypothetical protein